MPKGERERGAQRVRLEMPEKEGREKPRAAQQMPAYLCKHSHTLEGALVHGKMYACSRYDSHHESRLGKDTGD